VTEKIVKCAILARNDDVFVTSLKNAVFARRETPEFMPLLWPPNLPDFQLNKVCGEYWKQGVQNIHD